MKNVHVVLYQPEIPQNTGNIARTCAAVGAKLHLIRPLGFSTDNRHLKRAGLDYWPLVEVSYHNSLEELFNLYPEGCFVYMTKFADQSYDEIDPHGEVFLVFGSEMGGLPGPLLAQYKERCYRIPMVSETRSLNLSNAVAVVVYEVFRLHGFQGLEISGKGPLTRD